MIASRHWRRRGVSSAEIPPADDTGARGRDSAVRAPSPSAIFPASAAARWRNRNPPSRVPTTMNARSSTGRHIKLHSHPTGRRSVAPILWGAPSAARRGPVVGTLTSQRNAIGAHSGALLALSRARRRGRDARPGACAGSDQHRTGHPHRPASQVERSVGHRLARSLRPHGERSVRRAARRRLGHSSDHRGDQGTGEHARISRCDGGGQAPTRWRHPHRERRRPGDQGGDRAGLVPAGHRRAVRHRRERLAPWPVRAIRRHVLGAGDP